MLADDVAAALIARARAAWPEIDGVDAAAFVAHVERSIADASDAAEALDDLHVDDLWLAFAAGHGDARAIAAIDRQIGPVVEAALARMKPKVSPDDVAQLLREKLFVAKDEHGPKVLDYSGRGPLGGWIRIAAVRLALSGARRGDAAGATPVTRETLVAAPTAAPDPEMEHLRRRYASDFKQAFEEALAALSPEERNVLRLSVVDGLSIDEIGTVFGIHRATAARRIASARDAVQDRTRAILLERLGVRDAELESIAAYVRSHLDLSLHRVLAEDAT